MSAKPQTPYTVEIDQMVITAPDFPRPAEWWVSYLPLWFRDRKFWTKPESEWNTARVTVRDDGMVTVEADDKAHATAMARWLRNEAAVLRYWGAHTSVQVVRSNQKPAGAR